MIRFLTETDYPPFNFTGPDGNPAGFNVDLARLLCDEIKVSCTIQMRRFETLLDAIERQPRRRHHRLARGDAADARRAPISPIPITGRRRASCRAPTPRCREVRPEYLEGKKVGVIAGTAHEAYLKAMFTDAELHPYPNDEALRAGAAPRRGRSSFSATHLAGVLDQRHRFRRLLRLPGGPFVESRYFGEGVGIAVARATICCGKR